LTKSGHIVFRQMEEIIYGQPADKAVGDIAARFGAERIFVMASGTLNRTTDEVGKLCQALGPRCAGVFDKMPPHTPREGVISAAEQAREAGADLIVTLGGGSITDGAKGVQLCLANNLRTTEDLDALRPVPGADGVAAPPPLNPPTVRQISVPTTLSGGEYTPVTGITDERTKTKELCKHPAIVPQATILDPAVTIHTPEWLWLSTGVRAIDHCVEGMCSNSSNPFGDAEAAMALTLLSKGLRQVKDDPADLQARLDCQLGGCLSSGPFGVGVPMGASHGIGYVLGSAFDVPHGHTSCIMLPAVSRWNRQANADRQETVATAMGRPGEDVGDILEELITELGMPGKLSDVGIGPDKFDQIAEASMAVPWIPHNPRAITNPAQIREILEMAA